jgi:uncharacterized protein (DUF1778 family)
MPVTAERTSRLVTRIPSQTRKTIQAAADLEGASLNRFVTEAAHQKALNLLERANLIRLNAEQTRQVFDLVENPPKPNRALRSAKAAHKRLIRA